MKICRIWLKDYYQFKDVYIDLTHPETGEPLEKICLIGKNGVGKSLLLQKIITIIRRSSGPGSEVVEFQHKNEKYVMALNDYYFHYFKHSITEEKDWLGKLFNVKLNHHPIEFNIPQDQQKEMRDSLILFAPAESEVNNYLKIQTVPQSSVNDAISLKLSDWVIEISAKTVSDFWTQLIYHIRQREIDRNAFESKDENLNKTKRELIDEFDKKNPKILNSIAIFWNKILSQCKLYFDTENINNPVQQNDNLHAFIKSIDGVEVPYNALSTGIRNFIFKLGHIHSVYFNREVNDAFLLVDEPENSLHPDFLYDLIEIYQQCSVDKRGQNNSQLFVATHSPIIAAQFEPYERIILDWDEMGNVKVERGKSPVGDDANDLLEQDFHVQNILGKKGIEMWERFVSLQKKLRNAKEEEKGSIMKELADIGSKYHF